MRKKKGSASARGRAGASIRGPIGPFARAAAARLEPRVDANPPAPIFARSRPAVFGMVVELLLILAAVMGFAAGVLVGKCCGARAHVVKTPSEQPEMTDVLPSSEPSLPPPTAFVAPTAKTVYHLSKTCFHVRGRQVTCMRVCSDCLREEARKATFREKAA